MIDKFVRSVAEAMAGIKDGSTVLIAGFAQVGEPRALVDGLIEQGARDLTVVHNTAGRGREGVARLIGEGRVRKIVCSFARSRGSVIFEEVFAKGGIELEILPQGTLAERMRAAAAHLTIAQTQHIADLGELSPEEIATPGLYVDRLVHVAAGDPPIKIE
jgi:3-oxoadipate CoA-transferase alpha subunit